MRPLLLLSSIPSLLRGPPRQQHILFLRLGENPRIADKPCGQFNFTAALFFRNRNGADVALSSVVPAIGFL